MKPLPLKRWALNVTAFLAGCVLLGGCVRIDYKVFREKFPTASPGSYIWHRIFP